MKKAIGDLPQKEGAVKDCKDKVKDALTKDKVKDALTEEQTRMQLAESTRPPFLHPKDPFVVLKADNLVGVDRVCAQRLAEDANNPPVLNCRLASDVVTGVELSGTVSRKWQAEAVLPLEKNLGAIEPLPVGTSPETLPVRALALETLLFDPNYVDLIDTGAPELFRAIQTSLEKSRTASGSGNTLTWVGQPPDPLSITRWDKRNPWLPVYLSWQASWSPAYAPRQDPNSESGPLAGWQFDPGPRAGDLVPRAGSVQLKNTDVLLEGATIISALSGTPLATNLGDFAKTAELKTKSMESIRQQVLGQSLDGFNDLLLRQTLGLCLPPFDPTKQPQAQAPAQVDTAVWNAMDARPQPVMPVEVTEDSFLPVRTGALKLVNLYVVDCFGQTRKLIDNRTSSARRPTVIASAALPPLPRAPADYHAGFSPRLAQPARLNFDWQPAGKASLGPVCGWIVANYLEKSFAVFSASGEPLGALESALSPLGTKTINSKVTFHWRAIPGSTLEIAGISNTQLRRFVSLAASLSADEGQAFLELVELVLRRTEGRVPAEDPAMAVLLGRPLALVQASLGLEVEGLPAGYWQTNAQKNLTFSTEGWEKLRVPVRLGGMNLPSDGLVGYLTEPKNENDPPSLFASDGATRRLDSSLIKIKYDQDLTVACADEKPVSLTLLMDASARVHATTGLLPRHQVSLPAEAARLAGLINEFYFGVAPVLGERPRQSASQPTMPRPSDAFGQWSWATRPDITAWRLIRPADDRARFADSPALTEGWLRLQPQQGDTVKS